MAYEPIFRMSIQDASGNYYYAVRNTDGNSWDVYTDTDIRYLESLPEGWEKTSIVWQRDLSYLGIFRSKGDDKYIFCEDARAIIQYIRSSAGVQGFGTLNIYIVDFSATAITYHVFYSSQLDFKTYSDDQQTRTLSISTLDSNLIRDLHAYGSTKYNIPYWVSDDPTDPDAWELNDAIPIVHPGIKLLYNANYTSSAKVTPTINEPLWYTVSPVGSSPGGRELGGFNHGAVGDGYHILPCMNQYTQITNNGTATFIGNDILQPFLIQGTQVPGAANFASESNFSDDNHSQPYTKNNFVIKNMLDNESGTLEMWASVRGTFDTTDPLLTFGILTASNLYADGASCIKFVLFEIDNANMPVINVASGRYCYYEILSLPLNYTGVFSGGYEMEIDTSAVTIDGYFDNTQLPANITLAYNKVYAFGIIYDDNAPVYGPLDPDPGAGISGTRYLSFGLGELNLSIRSKYDMGESGVPIVAPSFPPSMTLGFRPHVLLDKLVKCLPTTRTDAYGFPVSVTTDYTGESSYLSDPSATAEGDVIPYNIGITSAYSLHNLQGQSYLTASLNMLYDFCKKQLGCGAYILGSTFYIGKLSTIFDSSTMILDLGYDVSDLKITHLTTGLGSGLLLGYSKQDTNKDAGLDSFNTQLFFSTPISNIPGNMDYQETGIVTDMYAIEKTRAQRVTQPIGTEYDPANPSGDQFCAALYCYPDTVSSSVPLVNPSNRTIGSIPKYTLSQRNGTLYPAAQSTDPTAATAPYIYGLFFPDSAINVELSPCRALQRPTGAHLHSVLDEMDAEYLAFRNTTIMQFNNVPVGITGMESNLNIGSGASGVISEFSDKLIGDLPDQLFKPIIFSVKSKYPVNMYEILNTNPNGYIRFFWKNPGYGDKEYKMFLFKATQCAATEEATEFIGWALPDADI